MRVHVKELHISIGLPGSGKTTLFKKLAKAEFNSSRGYRHRPYHIDCDQRLRTHVGYKNMEALLNDRCRTFQGTTYLDGMFLTAKDVIKILDICKNNLIQIEKVIIHYWNPNREKCLWNDFGRREIDSSITIDNAGMDTDNKIIEDLENEFKDIKFEKQLYDIVMKPKWKLFADLNDIYVGEDGIAKGDSWSLGGDWCDCWGGGGTVHGDTPPDGIRLIDDLLEKVAPNITFLQYKKISNECVEIDEYNENDYYGGSVAYARHMVNIPALYDYLIENELINENDYTI
jgi:hypothetical protein